MLTSEQEAKGKWCPFTRQACALPEGLAAVNRHPWEERDQDCLCRGSACMSWRWQGWKTEGHISVASDPSEGSRIGDRLGYCGLAGAPNPYEPR